MVCSQLSLEKGALLLGELTGLRRSCRRLYIQASSTAQDRLGWRAYFALNACSFCPKPFGCICLHITAFWLVPCAFFDLHDALVFNFICVFVIHLMQFGHDDAIWP